jgi:CheY-like chemotaxis protein
MDDEQKRVVVAEDEGMTILMLRRALKAAGFEVVRAVPNGAAAVEAVRELAPDFVMLDVNMPRMNGIEAARRIMAERPVPIVMLSAYNSRESIEEALAAGASSYLVKPVVGEEIPEAVRSAFERFQRRSEPRIGAQ